jgi:hypothetical protein
MATSVTPTFLLKGIDPNTVYKDYLAGKFSEPHSNRGKIKIVSNMKVLAPKFGESNAAPVYLLKDKHNCRVVVATSNHNNYDIFVKEGSSSFSNIPMNQTRHCKVCNKEFSGRGAGNIIGFQEMVLLEDGKYRLHYFFWTEEEIFHGMECLARYILDRNATSVSQRDAFVSESLRALRLLHKLMYPNAKAPLKPCNDPSLLIANGGSLTWEEWENENHVYTKTDRVVLIPAKVEFIRNNALAEINN